MDKILRRRSGIALWLQIADEIRSELLDTPADDVVKLPSEVVLAARFGVNRHTVRTALRALADEGLVDTRHGEGTFICQKAPIIYPLRRRTRFSRGVGTQAHTKKGQLLSSLSEAADAAVAAELGLALGTCVIRLETLSMADELPITLATNWFEARRFHGIDEAFRETLSLTEAFKKFGIDDYVRKSTRVLARRANDAELGELKLTSGAIVLVTQAVNATLDGRIFHYAVTRFPADRVTLQIETETAE